MDFNNIKLDLIKLNVPTVLFKYNDNRDLEYGNMFEAFKYMIVHQLNNDIDYIQQFGEFQKKNSGSFNKVSVINFEIGKKTILRESRASDDIKYIFDSYYENIKHLILYLCYRKHKIIPKPYRIGIIFENNMYRIYLIMEGGDIALNDYINEMIINSIVDKIADEYEISEEQIIELKYKLKNIKEYLSTIPNEEIQSKLTENIDGIIEIIIQKSVKPTIYKIIYLLSELNNSTNIITEFIHNDLKINNVIVKLDYHTGNINDILIIDFGTSEFIINLNGVPIKFISVLKHRPELYGPKLTNYNIFHDVLMVLQSIIYLTQIDYKKNDILLKIFDFQSIDEQYKDKCSSFFLNIKNFIKFYKEVSRFNNWTVQYGILTTSQINLLNDEEIHDDEMRKHLDKPENVAEIMDKCVSPDDKKDFSNYEKKYYKYKMKYLKLRNNQYKN